jgi:hypothetical protein
MKVVSARITEQPKSLFDQLPRVYVTTEDGTEHYLYSYYPDEINFTENEFIGLTLEECSALYTKKDLAYLRS